MNVKNLSKALLVTAIFFSAGVAQAWTEPTVAAPNGNVTVPLRLDANGRLGIGTTNALYTLDVSGSIRSTTNIISSTFQTNTGDLNISGSGWGMIFNVDVDANSINNYIFRGDNVEIMRLTDTGNLGIGVASPATKLQVDGDVRSNTGIFSNLEANDYIQINPTDDSFRFFSNSNEMLSILANGNTGVGVAAPAYRLDVAGDVNVPTGRCYRVNGVCIGSSAFSGSGTVNYVPKFTAASTVGNSQIFDNATNVGVGTAVPTEKLHVNGRITTTGSGYTLNPAGPILGQYTAGVGYLQAPSAGSIQIWKDDTTAIAHFDENGRVGIGTVTPTQTLSVAGNISKSGGWIAGNANWGQDSFEIHTPAWDGVSNTNYGTIAAGKIYAYRGLQSGGGTGAEATDGELYVAGRSMLMGPVGIGTTDTTNFAVNVVSDRGTSMYVNNSYNTSGVAISGNSQFGANGKGVQGSSGDGYGVYGTSNYGFGIYCYSNATAQCGGNRAWTNTSDIRLKKNVETITNGLDKVLKLRGVTFNWKEGDTKTDNIGFIAQEVLEVVPEVVTKGADGYYTIKESSLNAVLVEAVKELKAENDDLRARLERLEAKVQ